MTERDVVDKINEVFYRHPEVEILKDSDESVEALIKILNLLLVLENKIYRMFEKEGFDEQDE